MSALRAWVAAVACGAFVTGGCGATWAPATAVALPALVTGAITPRSIDVLPLDIEVWTENGVDLDVGNLRASTESSLIGEITADLYRRGDSIGTVMDWSGSYVDGAGVQRAAMSPVDLLATVNSLARYGERIPPRPAELPIPYLPVRLGASTGTDATLYVGGWGYASRHHAGTGEKVAEGVGIVLLVAVFAVVLVAMAKGGGGGGLGHVGGAVANGAGKVAMSASRGALHVGNALVEVARTTAEVENDTGLVHGVIDAMGREHTEDEAAGEHPEWASDSGLPHAGNSQMFVEMTLVDNHTGLVLWHAHQRFPADPRKPKDVKHAARVLLASFPGAR